ncbi:hypothetical protein NLI96_g3566 [Meripilus lineatus]|uniref:Transcriptional coactivator p15 (PC4) C-terminal domain-containing protein n=1 Tax=Meripilus lineatus TaxID=2056292 RepID=A0AAD5V8N8_9APHY|nr:hypothetical protein NLI96_g3566 [Physisporinus lineatus]
MPKKPTFPSSDGEEDYQQSGSESEAPLNKPASKRGAKGKQAAKTSKVTRRQQSSDEEEDEPPVKKRKIAEKKKVAKQAKPRGSDAKLSEEGDQYVDLGKRKRATVRTFNKMVLLDIREFYEDRTTGNEKPGKKGISLSKEQWEALKSNMDTIDRFIAELE